MAAGLGSFDGSDGSDRLRRVGPVEDVSQRTEASQTIVNPDNSRNLVEYAQPRWVRRSNRSWVPVDTTLRRASGAIEPGATIVPVTFSAGGTAALARLVSGDRELVLSWPAPLPAPVLQGDTAVYPDVYPDVDPRVTANEYGFTKLLVVKTRAAARNPALARITFGLSTRGLSVSAVAGGGAEARDPTGAVVFESPQPMMWDSSGVGASAGNVAGRRLGISSHQHRGSLRSGREAHAEAGSTHTGRERLCPLPG